MTRLPITLRLAPWGRVYRALRYPLRRVCDLDKVRASRFLYGARTHEEGEHDGWVLTPLGIVNSTPLGVIFKVKIKAVPGPHDADCAYPDGFHADGHFCCDSYAVWFTWGLES